MPKKNEIQSKIKKAISDLEEIEKRVEAALNNPKAKAAVICEPAAKKSQEDMGLQLKRIKKDEKDLNKGDISPATAETRLSQKKKKSDQALDRIKAQFPDSD